VHQSLAKSELLPSEHLVDMGYTGCRMLVDSQQRHGVVIVDPVVADTSWQAHAAEGFSKTDFHVDWDQQVVPCPAGKQSISWLPSNYPKSGMQFEARFARNDCAACPMRSRCTRSKVEPLQP
jgi:transposase